MPASNSFMSNFKADVTGNTSATVSADLAVLIQSGGSVTFTALSSTLDLTGTGLNKLDTGTIAASTWYYLWAVSNGTTSGVVASTSYTSPAAAITSVYPYYARLAATLRTNSGADLIATRTRGNETQYFVGGTNLTGLPLMASGSAGAYSSGFVTTWANVSLTDYVPTNVASNIKGILFVAGTGIANVSPNSAYAGSYANSGPGMSVGAAPASSSGDTFQFDYILDAASIVWASVGNSELYVQGWQDTI